MWQGKNRSPFRYAIVSNEREGRGRKRADGYRYVEVLLDERAFSEENLRELFRLISKRFPQPRVLHVQVYTNLEDVETPEEREMPKASEASLDTSLDRYHQAFFLRDSEASEWFTYNPSPPGTEMRKVLLKGAEGRKGRK